MCVHAQPAGVSDNPLPSAHFPPAGDPAASPPDTSWGVRAWELPSPGLRPPEPLHRSPPHWLSHTPGQAPHTDEEAGGPHTPLLLVNTGLLHGPRLAGSVAGGGGQTSCTVPCTRRDTAPWVGGAPRGPCPSCREQRASRGLGALPRDPPTTRGLGGPCQAPPPRRSPGQVPPPALGGNGGAGRLVGAGGTSPRCLLWVFSEGQGEDSSGACNWLSGLGGRGDRSGQALPAGRGPPWVP